MSRLSIVLPARNESGNIRPLLHEIAGVARDLPYPVEVIIVDDGSTDGTAAEAEHAACEVLPPLDEVTVVRLKGGYGQTVATAVGFLHATGDVIVTMDADRQNNPADIPKLLTKLEEGYDVVAGWRRRRKDPLLTKVLPSRLANILLSFATGVKLHDVGCTFRAYRSWVVQGLAREGFQHRYLPIYCAAKGARIAEAEISHRPRTVGQSKYGLGRFFSFLWDLPLLYFLGRYGLRPSQGLIVWGWMILFLSVVAAAFSLIRGLRIISLILMGIILSLFLFGIGYACEVAFRVTEKRALTYRQAVAGAKTIRAPVEA